MVGSKKKLVPCGFCVHGDFGVREREISASGVHMLSWLCKVSRHIDLVLWELVVLEIRENNNTSFYMWQKKLNTIGKAVCLCYW